MRKFELSRMNYILFRNRQQTNTYMRTIIYTIALIITITTMGFRPIESSAMPYGYRLEIVQSEDTLKEARENYINALNSDNEGLIASAIHKVVMLKIRRPATDTEQVKEKLSDLAIHGANYDIRYRAYLALIYLQDPETFSGAEELAELLDYERPEEFFSYIDKRLRENFLTLTR